MRNTRVVSSLVFHWAMHPESCAFVPVKGQDPFVTFGIDHLPWLRICTRCNCLDGVEVAMYHPEGPTVFNYGSDGYLAWCSAWYFRGRGWEWNEIQFELSPEYHESSFFIPAWRELLSEAMTDPDMTLLVNPKDLPMRALELGLSRQEEFDAGISVGAQSL